MIAELKNSKNSTMQEDAGEIDAATIPSAIIIKDERLSNPSTIGCASASGSASVAATNVTHLQSHHVGVKNESENTCGTSEATQTNYKRKLMFSLGHDDNGGGYCGAGTSSGIVGMLSKDNVEVTDGTQQVCKKPKLSTKKDQMFELFQPWALKTYGDQAKTKTITLRKKARILKALEGKEHSRPDSSKFRFWVKSKAFTTKKPECFQNIPDYPSSSNTEYPNNVDLYVASTTKDFGQRTYRKVAVVEEFFNIIYNIHVEMGGRSGRHAGQKRTYRIITETFAFLPREAVTRFLSACPECKKNLRPLSPGRSIAEEDIPNDSSTEIDVLNYSSQTETSMEIPKPSTAIEKTESAEHRGKSRNPSPHVPKEDVGPITESSSVNYPSLFQKIRINPTLQTQSFDTEAIRSAAIGVSAGSVFGSQMNFGMLNRESLVRYYDFMRRLYGQSASIPRTTQEETPKPELEPEPEPEPKQEPEPEPESEPEPEPEPAPEIKHTAHKLQPEAIDLTIEDQSEDQGTACSISTPIAMHSESTQETSQQICAINLSKTISRYSMIPKVKQVQVKQQRRSQQQSHQIQSVGFEMSGAPATPGMPSISGISGISGIPVGVQEQEPPHQLDLRKVKPITSTYLQLTRSMGLTDADALKLDDLEPPIPTPPVPDTASDTNPEDPYAGLMKDADKLKLMLLAWNYQNSNAVRNGTEGPDLGVVGGLWAQYQNALAQNVNKMETSISPVPRAEESSPMENQDETNSSGQKEEDEGSEDDSDDKLDQQAHDPERLKAFNMFVRLFVDENLDRIIPISKQPKEKIQAIIDSCARQFPEFSERSRKRIRTYLKSCRRNKKAREGWDNTTRPTPAHLTSVQAEQILAIACENESLNAKRMRIGLDPITQAVPLTTSTSSTSTVATSEAAATSTPFTSGFRSTPNPSISESDVLAPTTTSTQGASSSARSSPLALSTTSVGQPLCGSGNSGTTLSNGNTTVTSVGAIPASSPLYRPTDFTSPTSTSPYAARTPTYPSYFPAANATPTDLSMKAASAQQPTQSITSTAAATSSSLSPNARPPPPLVTHKLSANEITAARQVITAYRESAAFLLRTADQVEQLLVQQQ